MFHNYRIYSIQHVASGEFVYCRNLLSSDGIESRSDLPTLGQYAAVRLNSIFFTHPERQEEDMLRVPLLCARASTLDNNLRTEALLAKKLTKFARGVSYEPLEPEDEDRLALVAMELARDGKIGTFVNKFPNDIVKVLRDFTHPCKFFRQAPSYQFYSFAWRRRGTLLMCLLAGQKRRTEDEQKRWTDAGQKQLSGGVLPAEIVDDVLYRVIALPEELWKGACIFQFL